MHYAVLSGSVPVSAPKVWELTQGRVWGSAITSHSTGLSPEMAQEGLVGLSVVLQGSPSPWALPETPLAFLLPPRMSINYSQGPFRGIGAFDPLPMTLSDTRALTPALELWDTAGTQSFWRPAPSLGAWQGREFNKGQQAASPGSYV